MKNIELKIALEDFKQTEKILKTIGASYRGKLFQVDSYFNSACGRLKLREINRRDFELIFYQRPDKEINKLSNYHILRMNIGQAKELKKILSFSCGAKTVITKTRRLWTYRNTRVHFDVVAGLGNFLELETVLEKISRAEGQKEYKYLYEQLNLGQFKKIKESYSDLLKK